MLVFLHLLMQLLLSLREFSYILSKALQDLVDFIEFPCRQVALHEQSQNIEVVTIGFRKPLKLLIGLRIPFYFIDRLFQLAFQEVSRAVLAPQLNFRLASSKSRIGMTRGRSYNPVAPLIFFHALVSFVQEVLTMACPSGQFSNHNFELELIPQLSMPISYHCLQTFSKQQIMVDVWMRLCLIIMKLITNVPKSKSISIAFHSCKSSGLTLLLLHLMSLFLNPQASHCQEELTQLYDVELMVFLLVLILDLCSLAYFYFTSKFSQFEFYVFFVCRLLIVLVSLIFVISERQSINISDNDDQGSENTCEMLQHYQMCLFAPAILWLFLSILIMNLNLSSGLFIAHSGCNMFWLFLYTSMKADTNSHIPLLVTMIPFTHVFHLCLSWISVLLIGLLGKTSRSNKIQFATMLISLVGLMLCFLLSLFEDVVYHVPSKVKIFIELYRDFGLLEMLPPVLYLTFVYIVWKDPREDILIKTPHAILWNPQHNNFNLE